MRDRILRAAVRILCTFMIVTIVLWKHATRFDQTEVDSITEIALWSVCLEAALMFLMSSNRKKKASPPMPGGTL